MAKPNIDAIADQFMRQRRGQGAAVDSDTEAGEQAIPARERGPEPGRTALRSRENKKTAGPAGPRGTDLLFNAGQQIIHALPLKKVRPDPEQPRRFFDEDGIERLATSIAQYGQRQPIEVRLDRSAAEAPYVIVSGERRWRALTMLSTRDPSYRTIRARIEESLPDAGGLTEEEKIQLFEYSLLENVQREDLHPRELYLAMQYLSRHRKQAEIADLFGFSRPHITNILSIGRLSEAIQEELDAGPVTVPLTQLAELSRAPHATQEALWPRVKAGMSRNELRAALNASEKVSRNPTSAPVSYQPAARLHRRATQLARTLERVEAEGYAFDDAQKNALRDLAHHILRMIEEPRET